MNNQCCSGVVKICAKALKKKRVEEEKSSVVKVVGVTELRENRIIDRFGILGSETQSTAGY